MIRCNFCGHEIDPSTCHCGDVIDGTRHDGHSPVAMGCECHDLENLDGMLNALRAFREWVAELRDRLEKIRTECASARADCGRCPGEIPVTAIDFIERHLP